MHENDALQPMSGVNKTLYIPLYGKAFVSQKGIILRDKKAEELWEQAGLELKGKSKSKWLAYDMAMRAGVYDEWAARKIREMPDALVLHIGCGLDGRIERVAPVNTHWYDIDFPDVIAERQWHYAQTPFYHMVAADMRKPGWKAAVPAGQRAIVLMEGVSMYFQPHELAALLADLRGHFTGMTLLMDCYSTRAARLSQYKNPINDVGVNQVYGYDDPAALSASSGLLFVQEHCMTPAGYINELPGAERIIFKCLFAGRLARSLYRMYEFQTP